MTISNQQEATLLTGFTQGEEFWAGLPQPVAGVDEAGRGCLAGPVVAGSCILPVAVAEGATAHEQEHGRRVAELLAELDDSKKLTAKRREKLEPRIKELAVAWGLGVAWPEEVDDINILQATKAAMARAVDAMKVRPGYVLVDGNQTFSYPVPMEFVIKGDSKVPAISAASILAKTFRDRLMVSLGKRYPAYDFAGHKGYGTKVHMAAVAKHGPCRMHRMTFRGVRPEDPKPGKATGGTQGCLPGL